MDITPRIGKPGPGSKPKITADLLRWYDSHARELPWRAKPGVIADPYRVWLSEIMLQQTTVESVKPYFAKFLARWPDVTTLAAAEESAVLTEWAGLGYYARARNLIAAARKLAGEHGGRFPDTEEGLRGLPGVGAYTAAAIAAIAFNRRAIVIDGNIERVVTRLFSITTPLPGAKSDIRAALDPLVPEGRSGDFAQALMDLGATLCTPRAPDCLICPIRGGCSAAKAGNPTDFPVKAKKKAKPVKHGVAWLAFDAAGRLLLRTRAPKGLLANMAEVPNGGWAEGGAPPSHAPFAASWTPLAVPVIHVFTHFELRLAVHVARLASNPPAPAGMRWVSPADLDKEPLPTLFRKVIAAGP